MCDKEAKSNYEQVMREAFRPDKGQIQPEKASRPMSQLEKLDELFKYHHPRPNQLPKYHAVRSAAKYLGEVILTNTP